MELLDNWKNKKEIKNNEKLYITAADVQSLYPNVRRELIKRGITEALQLCSSYNKMVRSTIVDLTMFCLENVVVKHGDNFYTQSEGIITGDNNSVSIANITLHHVLLPISSKLNDAILFKRYIDDIIWISSTEELTTDIQTQLTDTFLQSGLNLTFRKVNTEQQKCSVEFLDVNHVIDANTYGGFYVTNYIKPTAVNRTFLNGQSHHPRAVYKSIVFGECIR